MGAASAMAHRAQQRSIFYHLERLDAIEQSIELIQQMRELEEGHPFARSIAFYVPERDEVYSARGRTSYDFFARTYLDFARVPDYTRIDRLSVVRARDRLARDSVLALIVPVSGGALGRYRSFFIVSIPDAPLWTQLNPALLERGSFAMLYIGEQLISSSDPGYLRLLDHHLIEELEDKLVEASQADHVVLTLSGAAQLRVVWYAERLAWLRRDSARLLLQLVSLALALGFGALLIRYALRRNYRPLLQTLEDSDAQRSSFHDQVRAMDVIIDDLVDKRRLLQVANEDLRLEKLLFMLLNGFVEAGTPIYEHCLAAGLAVDRPRFACLLMRDDARNSALYELLSFGTPEGPDGEPIAAAAMFFSAGQHAFVLFGSLTLAAWIRAQRQRYQAEEADGLLAWGEVEEERPSSAAPSSRPCSH